MNQDPGSVTSPEPLACPHCGSRRNSRNAPFTPGSLLLHIKKQHPDAAGLDREEKPEGVLTCETCGKWKSRRGAIFRTEEDLLRHVTTAHPELRTPTLETLVRPNGRQSESPGRHSAIGQPVKFCPQCGCNLEVVAAALSFIH